MQSRVLADKLTLSRHRTMAVKVNLSASRWTGGVLLSGGLSLCDLCSSLPVCTPAPWTEHHIRSTVWTDMLSHTQKREIGRGKGQKLHRSG